MRMNKNLRMAGTAAILALIVGVTGCQSSGDRSTGQAINDKMTAMDVNSALNHDPVLKFPDVKVSVYNGTAQLTGFVDNDEQRDRAAQIAAGVKGVSQVVNEITMKPMPTGRATIQDPIRGGPQPPQAAPTAPH